MWIGVACCAISALASGALVAWLMRRPVQPTGAPTDPSAAVQVDTAQAQEDAAIAAKEKAVKTAKDILNENDAAIIARVQQLRERGKSGE